MHPFCYRGIREGQDSETLRKIVMLNIFLFLGAILLLIMGIVALAQDAHLLGIADFLASSVLFAHLGYLHHTGNEPVASRFGVATLFLFFCYLFLIGGVHTTSFMWLYTFPLFSLYLLGLPRGMWTTLLLFSFCTGFLFFDLFSDNINVYSKDFAIRFIPSYLLVSVLAFLVEHSRAASRNALIDKQQLLAGTINELQEKEKELEEARNQLERRVALRTAELEEANEHLRIEMEERKWAQQERLRLESELLRSEKMELLGRLAGGVAHDLNNVLSGIVSYPDLLLHRLPPDSDMRGPLQNIRRAGTRAAVIVQDLLTLARRGITAREKVQLNDVINAHLQSPEFINLQKNYPDITLETKLAADLQTLSGSPVHLEKAVMNLLINSYEAIENQGSISITTENKYVDTPIKGYDTTVPGNYVVLTISDTGMGIPEDNLAKIFEPFYTSKIMGRSGTGLGMTVVWGTVKDHEGYLDVKSVPNNGTTITVFLPALMKEEDATQAANITPPAHKQGEGQTILLVDDDTEQRLLGKSILTILGYRIETVASGEEAVAFLKKRAAELVLLDMIMEPGMDGLDTYRQILAVRPDQKVIIVSGYSETNRIKKAMELGVHSYVKKPYGMEELNTMIQNVLAD
ncbi:response regulator [Desulfopila sp. IMCC35006]|uniref:hybrid sensor histidine kinase/response regulator n=1 Tax=Desulfopila sp. IMCC35006 TaxID=2569542 RepID=UPI0010AD2D44|nr:response regulator [Desulfopila sp. IMCC35006]TKB28016.1 response regulator [Desulfopila sp. IMCC35006]